MIKSVGDSGSGFASNPITTRRPSGRRPPIASHSDAETRRRQNAPRGGQRRSSMADRAREAPHRVGGTVVAWTPRGTRRSAPSLEGRLLSPPHGRGTVVGIDPAACTMHAGAVFRSGAEPCDGGAAPKGPDG